MGESVGEAVMGGKVGGGMGGKVGGGVATSVGGGVAATVGGGVGRGAAKHLNSASQIKGWLQHSRSFDPPPGGALQESIDFCPSLAQSFGASSR